MEQKVTSLNIPKRTLDILKSLGKFYVSDLTDSETSLLKIELYKAPQLTALELLQEELLSYSILTYNHELDIALKDEIIPGRITELAGFPGSGKTQICLQLSVAVQTPKAMGGLEGQVVYMNTNKNFSTGRLKELRATLVEKLKSRVDDDLGNLENEENVLKNIYVFNIQNVVEIVAAIILLEEFLVGKNVKLLILDSIALPLRKVLDTRERFSLSYRILDNLQCLANKFKFAIVVTNNFTTIVENQSVCYMPSFGDGFFEKVNTRICLSKSGDNNYRAELVRSVVKPPVKVQFFMF